MQAKINKRTVDGAPADAERDQWIWDTEIKGFGLRVRPNGRKSYIVEYRPGAGGRSSPKRRYTIGPHGSPWTPDTARDEARRILGLVAEQRDPMAERSGARDREANTVADLSAQYIVNYAKRRQRSWEQTKRYFAIEVNPVIGHKAVETVTRQDVLRLLDRIVERAPIVANRTLSYLSMFFNWCIERGYVTQSPCAGLKPPGEAKQRERTLDDAELAEVWNAAELVGSVWEPLIKLLILTAQRRGEVAGMQWSELNLDKATWTIPADRAKNKRTHEVRLCTCALGIISSVPRTIFTDTSGAPAESAYVFTTTGRTPVSGFSNAKEAIDAAILERRRASDPTAAPMPGWTFHDLRRTATTGMARLGTHPHIADAILNHKQGAIRGVAAVYNRHAYHDERRLALEQWESHVVSILDKPAQSAAAKILSFDRGN